MKREYPDRPWVGVGAIIVEDGKVALVRRAKPPLEGEWSVPGGAMELGETVREAAVREALEEIGLVVEPGDLLGVFDRLVRDDDGRVLYHYVLLDFLCRKVAGELAAAGDVSQADWFAAEQISDLNLPTDTAQVIRAGLLRAKDWPRT